MKTWFRKPTGIDLLHTFLHGIYQPTGVVHGTIRHGSPYFFKMSFFTVYVYQNRHVGPARQRRRAWREAACEPAGNADEANAAVVEIRNSEEESQAEKCIEETVVEAAEANNEEKENSEEFGDHLDK